MTAVPIARTGPFQYASDDFLSGEAFCSGLTIDSIVLQHVHGYSESAATVYVLIFDHAPVALDVPLLSFKVPAGQTFSYGPPADGWQVQRAGVIDPADLQWAVSSTGNEYTASVETCWVNAQGIASVGV